MAAVPSKQQPSSPQGARTFASSFAAATATGHLAGSYLASADYSWSLGLLDAKVLDRQHWGRGVGDVQMRFCGPGKEVLGAADEVVTIRYCAGPANGASR